MINLNKTDGQIVDSGFTGLLLRKVGGASPRFRVAEALPSL